MSIQSGSRYFVTFCDLVDSSGSVVDTEAHLHITIGSTLTVLTRASGAIIYAQPSTDPETGAAVRNRYQATVTAGTPGTYTYQWHFPDIYYVDATFRRVILGPPIVEPTP